MRKWIQTVVAIFISLVVFIMPVKADMGPKPSVNITFKNMPEGQYYVTLLTEKEVYGPWHKLSELNIEDDVDKEAALAFLDAIKGTDYNCLNYIEECSKEHVFRWGYYPPDDFIIGIYFPNTKTVILSEPLERVAFDSYFTVTYTQEGLVIQEEMNFQGKGLNFLFRVIATVVIELLLGLLFGYRSKKERRVILITNLITQLLLHGIMFLLDYYMGALVWVFLFPVLEIGVFVIELIVYLIAMKDHHKGKTFFYALLANAITYVIGMMIAFGSLL